MLENGATGKYEKCIPGCNEIVYRYELSMSPYPKNRELEFVREFKL